MQLVVASTCDVAMLCVPGLHLGIDGLQKFPPLLHAAVVQLAELAQHHRLAQPQRVLKVRPHLRTSLKESSKSMISGRLRAPPACPGL